MSKAPNKSLIGAFVIGGVILVFLAIGFLGSGKLFKKTITFVLFFEKSINGLSVGSPVVFMGVPVGRVIDIKVDSASNGANFTIPIYVELYEKSHTIFTRDYTRHSKKETDYLNDLIRQGLRATLTLQSVLTGQLMIELSFIPADQLEDHISQIAYYKGTPVIPTVPSKLENILSEIINIPINEISSHLLRLTEGFEKLINTPNTPNLIPRLDNLIENINNIVVDFEASRSGYKKMLINTNTELNNTLKDISQTSRELTQALQSLFGENAPTVTLINQTLQNVSQSANSIRNLARMLEQQPESIIQGKNPTQP